MYIVRSKVSSFLTGILLLTSLLATGATPARAATSPTWSDQEIAGALNVRGLAVVTSVSCTSATFCVAAGDYLDLASNAQALVSTWNGTSWTDQEVGAALNAGGNAVLDGVSCVKGALCVTGATTKTAPVDRPSSAP